MRKFHLNYIKRKHCGCSNNAASDYACLANDIFSYKKEIEFDGELHNGVLVVESFLNCNSVRAIEIINKLMTSRMQQFELIVATELPIVIEHLNLDRQSRNNLNSYVEKLQFWMYGVLQWHLSVDRYNEIELRNEQSKLKQAFVTPTGLGTSAVKVSSFLQRKETQANMQSKYSKYSDFKAKGLGASVAQIKDLFKVDGD